MCDVTSDEDNDSLNTTVPFQVAYAVPILKAQGLEYDSVKIVITDANEDVLSIEGGAVSTLEVLEVIKDDWPRSNLGSQFSHGSDTPSVRSHT